MHLNSIFVLLFHYVSSDIYFLSSVAQTVHIMHFSVWDCGQIKNHELKGHICTFLQTNTDVPNIGLDFTVILQVI